MARQLEVSDDMILLLVQQVFQDDVVSFPPKVLGSKLHFRVLLLVEQRLLRVGPLEQFLIVETEVFEPLHMPHCKIELISTFFVR